MVQTGNTQAGHASAPDAVRSDPEFVSIHVERELHAARARAAQAKYRGQIRLFISASTAAAVLGGLLLYGIEVSPDGNDSAFLRQQLAQPNIRVGLGLLQAVSLGAVAWVTHLLSGSEVARVWLEHRMKAEQGRIDRAFVALHIGHRTGPEAFRESADYASKELIDDQLKFFHDALHRHEKRSVRLLQLGSAIAGIGAAVAATQGLGVPALLVVAAFIGVLSPALMAAVTSWEAASGDRERAKSSFGAWQSLNRVNGQRAELAKAVDAGDLAAAEAYLARAAEVLRADHAAFEAERKTAAQGAASALG